MGRRVEYEIVVVARTLSWRRATAPMLHRVAGVPMAVAVRWAKERRAMSPAGLQRKLKAQRN